MDGLLQSNNVSELNLHKKGIPEFLDSGRKSWTLDSAPWTLDPGRWTLDAGIWTLNSKPWRLDAGLFTLNARL